MEFYYIFGTEEMSHRLPGEQLSLCSVSCQNSMALLMSSDTVNPLAKDSCVVLEAAECTPCGHATHLDETRQDLLFLLLSYLIGDSVHFLGSRAHLH